MAVANRENTRVSRSVDAYVAMDTKITIDSFLGMLRALRIYLHLRCIVSIMSIMPRFKCNWMKERNKCLSWAKRKLVKTWNAILCHFHSYHEMMMCESSECTSIQHIGQWPHSMHFVLRALSCNLNSKEKWRTAIRCPITALCLLSRIVFLQWTKQM